MKVWHQKHLRLVFPLIYRIKLNIFFVLLLNFHQALKNIFFSVLDSYTLLTYAVVSFEKSFLINIRWHLARHFRTSQTYSQCYSFLFFKVFFFFISTLFFLSFSRDTRVAYQNEDRIAFGKRKRNLYDWEIKKKKKNIFPSLLKILFTYKWILYAVLLIISCNFFFYWERTQGCYSIFPPFPLVFFFKTTDSMFFRRKYHLFGEI